MTAKQIRFVEASLDTDRQVAEVAMFDVDGTPVKPFKQAAHVDGATGTVSDIVTALVAAGLMASA